MARGKSIKLKPFQKILTLLISGKPVSIQEIDDAFGSEIQMYRLSTYMWHIKTNAEGVIRPIKDGRKVTAYQLVNVSEVKKYMDRVGVTQAAATPATKETKAKKVSKLKDLDAQPVVAPVVEEVVVTEVVDA
jgi:hypothetical protein